MRNAADAAGRGSPEQAQAAVERFLKASRQPALVEPGEEPLLLETGSYCLEFRSGRLTLQAWNEKRNLVRRVLAVEQEKSGQLDLLVERFGKRKGTVSLLDLARPAGQRQERRSARLALREQFRLSLLRQFAGWRIAELSTEPDLEHSLSPVYPRALIKKGTAAWAAIAAPDAGNDSAGALSFGLIWLDYLRRREPRATVQGLALFLPQGEERAVCLRLQFLDPQAAQYAVFVYSEDGQEERIDTRDRGNLETRLHPCRRPSPEAGTGIEEWVERIAALHGVERVLCNDGAVSLRVRGLEFARVEDRKLNFGIHARHPAKESSLPEIEALAAELARMRAPGAADRQNPIYTRHPEAWLESQVRARIEDIDASLLPSPVYGQVPAFAGGERGVIDLLAVERRGRLAVLELKASEDIHLPMQALDYWMRVKWHLERNEFSPLGYFPGVPLIPEWPRLLLVAPALEFHPTSEVILRYFSPAIEVERIGIGVEWQSRVRVMFRMTGARPAR